MEEPVLTPLQVELYYINPDLKLILWSKDLLMGRCITEETHQAINIPGVQKLGDKENELWDDSMLHDGDLN